MQGYVNKALQETIKLIRSSQRSMPAHFTTNGERTKSFCIDFEPLTVGDEYEMASEAWMSIKSVPLPNVLTSEDLFLILHSGEDIMVGAFIITKLEHEEMIHELKYAVVSSDMEELEPKIPHIKRLFLHPQTEAYFEHCLEFGKNRAKGL